MSKVQEMGLHMLVFADDVDRSLKNRDELRRALIASGKYTFDDLFPPVVQVETSGDINDPEASYDFSGVKYESPTSGTDAFEEFERYQQSLLDGTAVVLDEGELEAGEWI